MEDEKTERQRSGQRPEEARERPMESRSIKGQILAILVPRCQELELCLLCSKSQGMWPIGFRASAATKGVFLHEVLALPGSFFFSLPMTNVDLYSGGHLWSISWYKHMDEMR